MCVMDAQCTEVGTHGAHVRLNGEGWYVDGATRVLLAWENIKTGIIGWVVGLVVGGFGEMDVGGV